MVSCCLLVSFSEVAYFFLRKYFWPRTRGHPGARIPGSLNRLNLRFLRHLIDTHTKICCNSHYTRSCSTLSPVSTGMGDRLWAGIPPWYVIEPTRSTQPCIPLGSLNRVPALIGWGKGGNVTSAGWQVTLCDPIWHVSFRSGAVLVAQTAIRLLPTSYTHTHTQ